MREGNSEIIEVLKTSQSKVQCTLDHQAICNITSVIYRGGGGATFKMVLFHHYKGLLAFSFI